jgi:hypothetical protein
MMFGFDAACPGEAVERCVWPSAGETPAAPSADTAAREMPFRNS